MVSSVSAVAAYQKAIEASKRAQNSFQAQNQKFQTTAVLRVGDDLRIEGRAEKVASPQSFDDILSQELVKNPIESISSSTKTMFEIAKADGTELVPNVLALVESVDNAQLTVNTIAKTRDLIISAYQEIIRMPI